MNGRAAGVERVAPWMLVFTLAGGCQGTGVLDDDGTPADDDIDAVDDAPLYDADRLISVDITLDPADWDVLRHQERNLYELLSGDCLSEPFDSPFTWFPASVVVDGLAFAQVAVSKKGLIGSMSDTRPSLRLDFDRYVDGQSLLGAERLVLNNGLQDPSAIHQCLAYSVFTAAGLPASRCNFARVTVNGADLGVYTHVEAVREEMLARHFDDPGGNLYEGTLSDFREGWTGTFDPDSNEDEADGSDLRAFADALAVGDADLLAAIDPWIDVDTFLKYWGVEVLVGHWDGYTFNLNNFYVYRDPADGRFQFLPWGTDAAFDGVQPFGEGRPVSVTANGVLAHRLYAHPDTRDRYVARLRDLLRDVWDEAELIAEVDRMEALIAPAADPTGLGGLAEAVEEVRDVVRGRRSAIEAELDSGPPEWDLELPGSPCLVQVGSVEGTFTTTFGSYPDEDSFTAGTGTMDIVWDGDEIPVSAVGVSAGWWDDDQVALLLVAALPGGTAVIALLLMDEGEFAPGTFALDWSAVDGYVYYFDPTTMDYAALIAFLGGGTLTLEGAGTGDGAGIEGRMDAVVLSSSG